ncbi:hypothetical protein V1294_001980 [Bradyrhizobium sp. AZCC 1678]|uniref:hypothetical protein n=1 Tax=Bradyrhizobium sp. AZCC 1678 TaxID=3117030 RepID=UPI002FF1AC01
MANKSDQDFRTRKPVSVPASPRPAQAPAKRSGHVALLLMGTFAVGSAAYTLMPSRNCEPLPNAASPPYQQSNTECSSRSSSSSSGSSGSSSRSSYYSSDSSSSHSSSGTSDSGSHSAQRGGFGSFGHAVGFSGG